MFREELVDFSVKYCLQTVSKGVKMSKSKEVKRTMSSNLLRGQGTWGQSFYLGTWCFLEERTIRACLLKKVHLVLNKVVYGEMC